MNCLYTIPLCNFGFAFRHVICVIVLKKTLWWGIIKNQILPNFLFMQTIQKETVIWNCPVYKQEK